MIWEKFLGQTHDPRIRRLLPWGLYAGGTHRIKFLLGNKNIMCASRLLQLLQVFFHHTVYQSSPLVRRLESVTFTILKTFTWASHLTMWPSKGERWESTMLNHFEAFLFARRCVVISFDSPNSLVRQSWFIPNYRWRNWGPQRVMFHS